VLLSWLFPAGRGTNRHLMSPLWRLVLRWWCGGQATAVIQVVEGVACQGEMPQRASAAWQAAQLTAARLELAICQAEV